MITERQAYEALPRLGWLREYVDYASGVTDAHIAYHIACGLCVLSQAIPVGFVIPDGKVRGNFYAMLVGESTESRKTYAIEIANAIMQIALPDRIMANPGSEQKFVDALVDNPQQILFQAEGGPFFSSMESGYLRVLKDRLTQVYDCTRIARDTVTAKKNVTRFQDNPRFSLLVGISPSYLEGHTTDEDWTSGMLARFYTVLTKRERERARAGSNTTEERRLAGVLSEYADMASSAIVAPTYCLGYDETADRMWREWTQKILPAAGIASRTVKATVARGIQMAQKIALLLAWDLGEARRGVDWRITAECLAPAVAMAELHIVSAIEVGRTLSSDRDMRTMRRVKEAIASDRYTPISRIFREAQVTNRIGEEMLRSLLTQRIIELGPPEDDERTFRRLDRVNGVTPPPPVAPTPPPPDDPPRSIEALLFGS